LLGLAFVFDDYRLGLVTGYMALALMALSLDLSWGYAGILSFGQAAVFGLGAYGLGLTLEHWAGAGTAVAVVIGLVLGPILAGLLGWFVFYSRVGLFFIAVITLAVSAILEQLVNEFSTFTGGFNGVILSVGFPFGYRDTYLLVLGLFAVVLALLAVLVRSDFGRTLRAIRDNEERARFLGFPTPWLKLVTFCVAGGVAGAGGILYALQTQLVSPSLVGFLLSTQAVIWTAIGGRGTLVGPAIGAIGINLGQQELSGISLDYWQLALGALLVLVVVFAPDGLYALLLRGLRPLEPPPRGTLLAGPDRDGGAGATGDGSALATSGLSKRFGSLKALSDIDMEVGTGEVVCLIGPNGAGKSTLVDVITGRTPNSAGRVQTAGHGLDGARPEQIVARGVARTFQAGTVFESLSVFDNLALAARGGRLRVRDAFLRTQRLSLPRHVMELLESSGLAGALTVRAGGLSHGEKKWLELCMVLAQEPRLVLLDEPTAGLVEAERRSIGGVLRGLVERRRVSFVLIEHDLEFVREVADRVLVLDLGRLVAQGGVEEVAGSPVVREIYLGVAAE
jgi:branched-chain amino acid transport system permease protein